MQVAQPLASQSHQESVKRFLIGIETAMVHIRVGVVARKLTMKVGCKLVTRMFHDQRMGISTLITWDVKAQIAIGVLVIVERLKKVVIVRAREGARTLAAL